MEIKIKLQNEEFFCLDFEEYTFVHSKDVHLVKKKNGKNVTTIATMTADKFSPVQPEVLEHAFNKQSRQDRKNKSKKEAA